MRTSATSLTRYFIILVLSIIISCDSFIEEKDIPVISTQFDFYTLPGSSIIIDMKSVIPQSFASATLSISKDPQRGTLTEINTLQLKYRPSWKFADGEDYFILTAMSDGRVVAKNKVTIKMKQQKEEFPCDLIAVGDKVHVKSGSSASISILESDWFCDVDNSSLTISINMQPRFGQANILGDSIIYTAGPDYKGHDEFIYKLQPSSPENAVYGLISVTEWTAKFMHVPYGGFTFPPLFGHGLTKMVFVNENTGYLAGYSIDGYGYRSSIYRTTDGGVHWSEGSLPRIDYGDFADMNFLNEKEGFALYVPCDGVFFPGCGIGLVTTKDGGISWEAIPIGTIDVASSVFFTSSTTGFIGATFVTGNDRILKTIDGGATWNQVLSTTDTDDFTTAIKFSDAQIGYAQLGTGRQVDRIFITEDSGESWKPFTTFEHISAVAVVGKDKIFASLTTTGSFNNSSTIVRFQGASTREKVAEVPYKIFKIEFSPSGNVGFAAGISSPGSDTGIGLYGESLPKKLSINKSIDGGETWTEEYIEEYIESYNEPYAMAVPSENVVYILYDDTIIKYTNY